MLISILIFLWLSSVVIDEKSGAPAELGGGPIVKTEKFAVKETPAIVLEEFKKFPKEVAEPDPKPALPWTHSAIIMEPESGKVLFGKDERKKMPLASLTKVMTAIVVNEEIKDWNQDVKISQKAAFAGGANIHLKWDEIVDADDLFKAMLMNSDNTAAIALAEHVAGSTDEFAKLMDAKAKEIGALNTHFVEPSGLDDENSYSNAYDMAKITQYALKQERIVKTMQTVGPIQINSCDGALTHRVGNTNIFLKDDRIAFRVIGAKTGFTYNAGYCLMAAMYDTKKQRQLIGVILNSGQEMRWEEMKEMLNWGFDNYEW